MNSIKSTSESRDFTTSNILYKNDPDINCFSQLKQISFGTSDYYSKNTFKYSVDLQKININVCSLPKIYDTLCLCLTNLDIAFNVKGLTETQLTRDNAGLNEFNKYLRLFLFLNMFTQLSSTIIEPSPSCLLYLKILEKLIYQLLA